MNVNCLIQLSLFFIFCLSPAWAWASNNSSCVTCHTDDLQLKSLVKPPEISGEGEG